MTFRYRASDDVMACEFGDGLALFDLKSNSYFSLNRSGALIWRCASSPSSRTELRRAVASAFDTSEEQVAADVDRAVEALVDAQLFIASPHDETGDAIAAEPAAGA